MEQSERIIDVVDCLRRWNEGEESAAEELIDHLHPLISRIARSHLPRWDQEEDIVQEVLMKMFSRLHQYRADAPLNHWVSRVALTTCFNRLRVQKVRPEICWTDLTPEESETFEAAWLGATTPDATAAIHARDMVNKLLSTLPSADRSLILQVGLEGLTLEEISKRRGWGLSKLKLRLFRMRVHLRKTMQELEQCR